MTYKNIYFSIIIPCFNASKYIDRCIKSLNKQTYKNYEAIFIDDCSIDDTHEILKKYQKDEPKFKILKTKINSGPAAARNLGIVNAKGKFICFLDVDDWWFSKKLEIVHENTLRFSEEIFCHNEILISNSKYIKKLKYYIKSNRLYEYLLLTSNELSTSATVVKLNFIKKNKIFFNESKKYFSVEDYDYWLKLTFHGAKVRFINRILGTYNIHNTNISLEHNMHNNNVLNVVRDHAFNIQKISENKSKIWKRASLRFYLNDIRFNIEKFGLKYEYIIQLLKLFINNPIAFFNHFLFKYFK